MSPLMFCPIAGVAECLTAVKIGTDVRPFSGVRSQMDLQILQPRESLVTSWMLCSIVSQMILHAEIASSPDRERKLDLRYTCLAFHQNGRACGLGACSER